LRNKAELPMAERIYLYDTTLRDGAQTQGVSFTPRTRGGSPADLDALGIDYIEGGARRQPHRTTRFFQGPAALHRHRASCAFGND
jgi:2-isopropylmalate synthase